MAADRSLVVAPEAEVSADQWRVMRDQAAVFVKSGFLPSSIRTPEQALTVMLTGRELGIPPMTAIRLIAVVDGKPTIEAELMAAMIFRDHGGDALRLEESTAARATYRYKRRGWPEYRTFTFTIEEAKQAGLLGKKNWQGYPAAMLRARCVSAIGRLAFPDTIGGMYTPEELNADQPVTRGQIRAVHALDENAGVTRDERHAALDATYGVQATNELTTEQASAYLDARAVGGPDAGRPDWAGPSAAQIEAEYAAAGIRVEPETGEITDAVPGWDDEEETETEETQAPQPPKPANKTEFWVYARQAGIDTRSALDRLLGRSVAMTPETDYGALWDEVGARLLAAGEES